MTTPSVEAMSGIGIVSAVTLALFGVPLQPIVWGFIGGCLGAAFAKPASWFVSGFTYFAASLVSALVGHAIGARFGDGSMLLGNVASAGVAVFFHPLLSVGIQKVPAFVDWALSLLTRRGQP